MSLVTFVVAPNGGSTPGFAVMPEDLTITSRRIFSINVGEIGNAQAVAVSITNCIADTGATFTATFGHTGYFGATGNICRGFTVDLPRKGLYCSARGTTTVSVTGVGLVTSTAIIDYEKG